jgi:trk system potassium uptake protein TrkA
MRSFLVIGLGRFGQHLVRKLVETGCEVMAVDTREDRIRTVMQVATSVEIGDCTKQEVLGTLGVANYDVCFVCVANDFQSSLVITDMLKENGAQKVISRASRDIQAKFLLRNGADEVIYPERDFAERLAVRCAKSKVFDYMELSKEVSVYEIATLPAWVGKTIRELNFRTVYKCSILAVKKDGATTPLPTADYRFDGSEHLMLFGRDADVDRIVKELR